MAANRHDSITEDDQFLQNGPTTLSLLIHPTRARVFVSAEVRVGGRFEFNVVYVHRDRYGLLGTGTSTSTFTQLLNIFFKCCVAFRDHNDYWGRGTQDAHLDFHRGPERLQMLLYVHRNHKCY